MSSQLNYRIFLSVTDAESGRLNTAIREVWNNTYAKERLFLVGPHGLIQQTSDDDTWRRFAKIEVGATDHQDAFVEICAGFQDCDFLFVKASTIVPEYWDLRLAWTAASLCGVATVSPLSDGGFPFSMPGHHAETGTGFSLAEAELVDRICYETSLLENPEIADFLEDCFYVSSNALRDSQLLKQPLGPSVSAMRRFSEAVRQLHYSHVLADHVCVSSIAKVRQPLRHHPDSDGERLAVALKTLRYTASKHQVESASCSIAKRIAPRHLHLMHTWGGGLERWVKEYCRADEKHENFVLKSVGTPEAFGEEVWLFRNIDDPTPIQKWKLSPTAIKGTVVAHPGYDAIFSEVIERYGIERIIISSLIGHSLTALRSNPPTVIVCHDYYPFCPALNITFKEVCTSCGREQLAACTVSNPYNRFFHNLSPSESLEVRKVFIEKVKSGHITMVAPAASVANSYIKLVPELASHFRVITHGARAITNQPLQLNSSSPAFNIVVLGSLARQKGLELFTQLKDELTTFADVFLVGCGMEGEAFRGPKITVIAQYAWEELPAILQRIRPNVGLLLSVVPETFSYTLQELLELGIPTLATRLGSFEDRIEHGVNGFLCNPAASSILNCLRELAEARAPLARVHEHLCRTRLRTLAEMLEDYEELLGSTSPSAAAYFCPDARKRTFKSDQHSQFEGLDSYQHRLISLAKTDLQELQQTIAERERSIGSAKADIQELRDLIAGIVNSRSWKLTMPARAALDFARRAFCKGIAHQLRKPEDST